MSADQHSYPKDRSTETALVEVVICIEKALEYKEFELATFLDIDGAHNNVTTDAFKLMKRRISSTLGNSNTPKRVTRGTPQGGVLSPRLWFLLVLVNTILL